MLLKRFQSYRKKRKWRKGRDALLTVSYTNINDYVSLAEKVKPSDLFLIMHKFYDEQCEIIEAHKGYIADITADKIIAVWGITDEKVNHADMAIKSSILQQNAIDDFNHWLDENESPLISIRIGVNTADILVFGSSDRRLNVLGYGVNLAIKMCNLAKDLKREILISESTSEYSANYNFKELSSDAARDLKIFEIKK